MDFVAQGLLLDYQFIQLFLSYLTILFDFVAVYIANNTLLFELVLGFGRLAHFTAAIQAN